MAETFVGPVLEVILSKVISITAEQMILAWDFKKELKKLGHTLEMIKAFLQAVEESQLKDKAVKLWLQELNDVAYEADDVLEEFSYEILRRKVEIRNQIGRRVLNFFSSKNSIAFRLKMANKIKDTIQILDDLNKSANQFGLEHRVVDRISPVIQRSNVETVSFLDESSIVGRKTNVSKILNLLLNPKDDQVVSVVPIVGPAGLGKTTIAKMVYNDSNVERHFDLKFWVCVSDHFDVKRILKEMLDHFTEDQETSMTQNMNAMVKKLKEKIKQAKADKERIKYLLVLDDVWNVEKWEELRLHLSGINEHGGNGVIVTTRNQDVATTMQPLPNQSHQPGGLEDVDCWSIIKARASRGDQMPPELEVIGLNIAKQCKGVPLVAKVIAGIIHKIEMNYAAWSKIQESDVWDSGEVESVLKLSFDHLSSRSLKKCFAYCALFPKDHPFEKEQLIQLWMAEGFLGSSVEMMNIGNKYINELLSSFLLQDVEKDTCGNILTFKMHDLVHDLALSLSKFDTLIFEEKSTSSVDEVSHIRHLNVVNDGEALVKTLTAVAPKLHSLLSEIDVSKKLLRTFTSLRVLKLTGYGHILKLPASLGELKRLRYFDISKTSIDALPPSTTKLYNLQTLRFLGCSRVKLPYGLTNLISLKHILFDHPSSQPIELRRLTSLQTLPIFYVGATHWSYHHTLDALKCLNELGGELKICNLKEVRDKQEANGANLESKEKLRKVMFEWSSDYYSEQEVLSEKRKSEEVLEGLQPHSNLQSLMVRNYPGEKLPSWMLRPIHGSNAGLLLLDNLIELEFVDCINCESLPPLAQLHSLQFLTLVELKKVNRMGNEFYCNESSNGKNEVITVFPALKKFTLKGMKNLEEWSAMEESVMFPCLEELDIYKCRLLKRVPLMGPCLSLKNLRIEMCSRLSSIGDGVATATCLKELTLWRCPNLISIPELEGFSCLQNLSITFCSKLEVVPIIGRCSSLEMLRISDCKELREIGDGLSTSTCLKELTLWGCPNLISIPDLEGFSCLQRLKVKDCNKLKRFPLKAPLPSLTELTISSCPRLKPIPSIDGVSSLTKLQLTEVGEGLSNQLPNWLTSNTRLCHLTMSYLPHLISIPDDCLNGLHCLETLTIGGFGEDLEEFPGLNSVQQHLSASLRDLHLIGWEKLKSLPHQLQHLTALKKLRIDNFHGTEALPEWLGNLSSLQRLDISSCKKLMYMPSVDVMRSLSHLKTFTIFNCSELQKRCAKESGPEWSKISHIPYIEVNGIRVWNIKNFEGSIAEHSSSDVEALESSYHSPRRLLDYLRILV